MPKRRKKGKREVSEEIEDLAGRKSFTVRRLAEEAILSKGGGNEGTKG